MNARLSKNTFLGLIFQFFPEKVISTLLYSCAGGKNLEMLISVLEMLISDFSRYWTLRFFLFSLLLNILQEYYLCTLNEPIGTTEIL